MPISLHLSRKFQETLGLEAADYLVSWMEGMDAIRGDIGELRHEMQLDSARVDARFRQIDERFQQIVVQMDARFQQLNTQWVGMFETSQARFEASLEKGLREQTRFFFLAWSVLLAAMVGLYAR